MYVVTATNNGVHTVIHEPGTSQVKLDAAKISREKNKFASFTFDIYPDNPGFSALVPFATLITVTNIDTAETVFDGRVIQPSPEMDSDGIAKYTVTCEDYTGYLQDSLQNYVEETHYSGSGSMNGLQQYLNKLLTVHNSKVEGVKKIYLGNVTLQTFATSSGVTKSISRGSTWDNISDKILDSFGGEMRVRRGSDGLLYLDYAENLGQTRATRIEIARNMQDASREIDFNSVITRLYPYGAKQTTTELDENGQEVEVETEERLTIASVNGGKEYIDDAVGIETYGIVEGYVEFDDITQPANLLSRGQEYLGDLTLVPTTHSLTALDLSYLGLDYDDFQLYDSYPCYNPLIGLDETLEITAQTIDLNEPMSSTIDMGETGFRLSSDINNGSQLEDDYLEFKDQTATTIVNINNKTVANSAAIKVFSDSIQQTVTETVEETVSSQLGNVVVSATAQYYASTSSTELAGGEWGDLPEDTQGRYLWQRIVTTLKDGTQVTSDPVCLTQDTRNVTGVVTQYYRSTSNTEPTGGEWSNTPPAYMADTYLWTRTQITYSNPSGTSTSDPVLDSTWSAVTDTNNHIGDVNDTIQGQLGDVNESIGNMSDDLDAANENIDNIYALTTTNTEKVTQLLQTVDGWNFTWEETQQIITELNGTITTEYSERLKYIKFIDGAIWLGKDPDPGEEDYKVVINNERISFLQNNVEVAYISGQRLYITEAQITNRLIIGNFVFYPRDNGNMTLRYID